MASSNGHTVKAFDSDLGEIRALVSEMGGRAEAAIDDAMAATSTAPRVSSNRTSGSMLSRARSSAR